MFTFVIFSFVFGIAFVLFFVATTMLASAIYIAFVIDSFVFALWAGGSVAVEDDEEREAEKPKRVVLKFLGSLTYFRIKKLFEPIFSFLVY